MGNTFEMAIANQTNGENGGREGFGFGPWLCFACLRRSCKNPTLAKASKYHHVAISDAVTIFNLKR